MEFIFKIDHNWHYLHELKQRSHEKFVAEQRLFLLNYIPITYKAYCRANLTIHLAASLDLSLSFSESLLMNLSIINSNQ